MNKMPIEEIRESNRRRKACAYGATTDSRDIDALLAEIDRLRAREARMEIAMKEIENLSWGCGEILRNAWTGE